MANKVPAVIADFESQLSTSLAVGGTSFSLSSATDDDGNSLPAGKYCFTVDNGKSNKEYLLGQLNGTAVTSVVRVSRQGVETSGTAYAHRVGASVIISDFATIQRVADILRGLVDLDGTSPMAYDAEPTLADRKEIATVGYVLDTVTGGTVAFDTQTTTGNGGENIVAGELIYFKTSDQEWYKTDADTAGTVEGVMLGIALGAGSDGVAITGGVQISGTYTTSGLTAGSIYYAGNTAGAYTTSAGTTPVRIGLALSTTKLLLIPQNNPSNTFVSTSSGAGDEGKVFKLNASGQIPTGFIPNRVVVQKFTSSGTHTWTKPTGLSHVEVELWGGGGSGASSTTGGNEAGGGGGGGYARGIFLATNLGDTETVTVGQGGAAVSGSSAGNAGGTTSFGSLLFAYGGGTGSQANGGAAGGGGGGAFAVGGNAVNATAGLAGDATAGQGGNAATPNAVMAFNGAGGGGCADAGAAGTGGNSWFGGAGGGGARTGVAGAGGTSRGGGNGGAGEGDAGNAVAGSVPGGGGGANFSTGTSGAGGDGRCIVTEYFN